MKFKYQFQLTTTNKGINFMYKKCLYLTIAMFLVSACAPEVGTKEWCEVLKEKPKADWTATEVKDFTKHCIF